MTTTQLMFLMGAILLTAKEYDSLGWLLWIAAVFVWLAH